MKKITFCFIALSVIFVFVVKRGAAQTEFSKVYYQEFQSLQVNSVATALDGSYVIAGERNNQYFLLAINLTGDTLWNKTILGKDNYEMFLYVNIISLLDSSFLFVASYLNPDSDHLDVMCLKLDVDGNMIWSKTFDFGSTAEPYAVIQTIDKGFIITGRILQDGQPHRKILVLKLDSSGEVQWSKMMAGGDVVNQAYSMKQLADSTYILSGVIVNNEPYSSLAFLLKLTADGNIEWANGFKSSSNFNEGLDVVVDNGFLLAMLTSDSLFIVKTDFTGHVLWTKRHNSYMYNYPLFPSVRFRKTSDEGFALLSPIMSMYGVQSIFMRLDSASDILSANLIEMYAVDVLETTDKGFLIVGNGPFATPKSPAKFEPQIGVLKTDSMGYNGSECIFDIPLNAVIDTITSQPVLFTSETIGAISSHPTLQFISKPLTIRSGCVELTGAVDENNFSNKIRVYPNPSTGIFTIRTTNGEQLNTLAVYNAYGERVFQSTALRSTEIKADLSGCPGGIYFLRIRNNNKVYSRKIVLY